jgi:tetratricopeptide (TPR) repeat protein
MSYSKRVLTALICCSSLLCHFGQAQGPQKRFDDIAALQREGEGLAREGRLAEAEIPLEKAVLLTPGNAETLTLLGKIKARLGEEKDAILLLRKAVLAAPESGDAHLNLAIVLADSSDSRDALSEIDKAIKIDPKSAEAHLNRARILADADRPTAARAEFQEASLLAPEDAEVFFFWATFESKYHHDAKESLLLKKVVVLDPKNFRAYFLLGKSLQNQEREGEAIAAWRSAVALNPEYVEAIYSLGQALRTRDSEESKRLMEQFRTLQEKSQALEQVTETANHAYSLMLKQDWAEAIALFKQAIVMCGHCELQASLHQHLGLAQCHAGYLDEGKVELQRALSLSPDNRETVDALYWVSQQRKQDSGQLP